MSFAVMRMSLPLYTGEFQ